jgi:hypothetical protein
LWEKVCLPIVYKWSMKVVFAALAEVYLAQRVQCHDVLNTQTSVCERSKL